MVWLAMHNRLTTGDIMISWNAGIDTSCILCQQHLETRDHLLFECSYSQEVWSALVQGLLLSRFTNKWQEIRVILADNTLPKLTMYLLRYSFQVTLHSLWRERNGHRHGSQPLLASQLIKMIDRQIRNQCLILIFKRIRRHEGVLHFWLFTR